MKFRNWLNEWLDFYIKPTTKECTYDKYRRIVENHILLPIGEYHLKDLTAVVLQHFSVALSDKGLSANTVNTILSVVKSSLCRAVLVGVAQKEFSSAIVRPKIREKHVECFSKEEQRKIEKYITHSNKSKLFGIVLCLYTGLRIGELLALEWRDIDFNKGIIAVTKSCRDSWKNGRYIKIIDMPKTACSRRIIPIPKQLLPKIRELSKKSFLEYAINGKSPYGAQIRSYQKTFEVMLCRLKIPHKGFHSLRHTFSTRALECGMDVKTLSEILGHKNPMITLNRYAHSMIEHKRDMMNRIGKLLI